MRMEARTELQTVTRTEARRCGRSYGLWRGRRCRDADGSTGGEVGEVADRDADGGTVGDAVDKADGDTVTRTEARRCGRKHGRSCGR